jgi:hypothetical protein
MIFAEFEYDPTNWMHWRMVKPWATFATGFVAAHDLIEHSPTDGGNVEDEFMALGAGLILRDHIANHDVSELTTFISMDVAHVIDEYSKDCVKEAPHNTGFLSDEYQERFATFKEKVLRRIDVKFSNDTINRALAWVYYGMCRAYRLHAHRLEQIRGFYLNLRNMFDRLQSTLAYRGPGVLRVVYDWNCTYDTEFVSA